MSTIETLLISHAAPGRLTGHGLQNGPAMQTLPGAQCNETPVKGLPLPAQKRGLPAPMQAFGTNLSQNVPGAQAPTPGQQTPPTGAQLNRLGHRKKPGCPGQGGPDVALILVPGVMAMIVSGLTVMF